MIEKEMCNLIYNIFAIYITVLPANKLNYLKKTVEEVVFIE